MTKMTYLLGRIDLDGFDNRVGSVSRLLLWLCFSDLWVFSK
jgi:hypothetical protein